MIVRFIVVLLCLGAFIAAGEAKPLHAKIRKAVARATALAHTPGKVVSAELEEEGGVVVYSFDIREADGQIMEIHVDASTGAILLAKRESAAEERDEAARERRR